MRLRRPFAAASTLGLLAHNTFETRACVGLVFEPLLGRRGARALWAVIIPTAMVSAFRDGKFAEGASAFNVGSGFAGVVVHFTEWPWTLRGGLPMLDDAEGLRRDQLPAYNALLWGWGISCALSLLTETPPGSRRLAVAGLLQYPILLASARHHFRWAREKARLEPEAWSPALLES